MESGTETPRTVDPAARERTLAGLRRLQQIPALQSLARGFLHTLNQPDVSVPEVVEAIRKDSALCVRLLRAANSVLVSPERRIEDLDSAVQMLGVVRVRKMMQAMFTLRDGNRVAAGFDWRHLWIHALATAAIAEELEKRLRSAGDSQIHLAALLHDVGKIVLSTLAPEEYRDVLMRAWHDGGTLDELERDALGVDHREAGVVFVQHNRLPEVVVQAIAHHDNPAEATSYRLEVALISLANHLSKAHGLGFSGARLHAADAEFAELPAWVVVEEMCGGRLDAAAVEAGMQAFLAELRVDLRGLRESV
jgi:putative nucleotidyltransferase with HDIG domain